MNLQLLKKKNILDDPDEEEPNPYPPGFAYVSQDGSVTTPEEDEEDDDSSDDEGDETSNDDSKVLDLSEEPSTTSGPLEDRFSRMYKAAQEQPTGPATQALQDYLSKGAPSKDSIPISKTDRLAAILGGASEGFRHGAGAGIKTAQEVLDQPYEQATTQFKNQAGALEAAAKVESSEQGRKASIYKTAEAAQKAETDATEKKRVDDSAIQLKNAQIVKMQHPNSVFKTINGRVMAIDPSDPSNALDLGDANTLSPDAVQQKKMLEQWNSGLIGKREKDLESQKQEGAESIEGEREQASATKQNVELTHQDNKPKTAQERNNMVTLALRKAYAKYGSKMDSFVVKDAAGMPIALKHPDPNASDEVMKNYASVVQQLYGK